MCRFFAAAVLPGQSLKKFSDADAQCCSVLATYLFSTRPYNTVIIILNYADFAFVNI